MEVKKIYQFRLQSVEETFHGRIVVRATRLAHALNHSDRGAKEVNSLAVNCEPWSEFKINPESLPFWRLKASFKVRTAKEVVILLSVMLATTLLSYKSIIVQL